MPPLFRVRQKPLNFPGFPWIFKNFSSSWWGKWGWSLIKNQFSHHMINYKSIKSLTERLRKIFWHLQSFYMRKTVEKFLLKNFALAPFCNWTVQTSEFRTDSEPYSWIWYYAAIAECEACIDLGWWLIKEEWWMMNEMSSSCSCETVTGVFLIDRVGMRRPIWSGIVSDATP